ncbi:hypothetical protein B0H13DRAFT_2347130 [Mycena leptocephala]|nr:hypothetical protein B0H13DRAFT_2347130 [Mycena leptocephala]
MLQLTANGFKPGCNGDGFLMAANALSRAAFLTLAFPRLIAADTALVDVLPVAESVGDPVPPAESEGTRYTTDPSAFDPSATSGERENGSVHKSQGNDNRWVPGRPTRLLHQPRARMGRGPDAATRLTAPACKGVLLNMVPAARKSDALSAIALVETTAMILTVSLYGALFALPSDLGPPESRVPVQRADGVVERGCVVCGEVSEEGACQC